MAQGAANADVRLTASMPKHRRDIERGLVDFTLPASAGQHLFKMLEQSQAVLRRRCNVEAEMSSDWPQPRICCII